MKKREVTFSCPVCGNELYKTDIPVIKCRWCKKSIVPEALHFYREATENVKREDKKNEESKDQ